MVLHENIIKEMGGIGGGEDGGEPAEEQWFPIDLEFVAKVIKLRKKI